MNDIKMTLKALRINNNFTQQEAGEKLGVTKDTISRWENAKSFPDAMQIKAIEKLYHVTYNNIIFLSKDNA